MNHSKLYIFALLIIPFLSCHVSSTSKEKPVVENVAIKTEPGIHFIENDWDLALKTAHDQNKLVFLDIYATWCGPCKMLKQYTFTDSSVGEFFNKNFISVSVDGEKGVGPQLAQQYSIEGYPTLVVADATGKPVLLTVGYIPADVLMQFANEALKKGGQQVRM
jgi:thiol:disulfide interchange protein